jgi:nucleoid-associated protein YgaU
MGIFNFLNSAGKKLGFGGDEAPDAGAIKQELDSHGLGTDRVEVEVIGDKIMLNGVVEDQTIFEKAVIAVGNTLGISRVEATELKVVAPDSGVKLDGAVELTALIDASREAETPVFYSVENGDTLWKIAEAAYGKGQGGKYQVIFEANQPMLGHPDKIYPGQVLRIPDASTL